MFTPTQESKEDKEEGLVAEKKDAAIIRSNHVTPCTAYASGALVKCRKVGELATNQKRRL